MVSNTVLLPLSPVLSIQKKGQAPFLSTAQIFPIPAEKNPHKASL